MKLISSKQLLKTSIFEVTEDHAYDPDGFEIKRAIIKHKGSAVMMPVDSEGRILLVKQYRLPAETSMWELPAGRRDEGETVRAAAERELREETGLIADRWTELATFYVSPGFLDEKMTIFVAQDLREGERELMEDERIEIRWFGPDEISSMLDAGELIDAKTMLGFLLWQRRAGTGAHLPSSTK